MIKEKEFDNREQMSNSAVFGANHKYMQQTKEYGKIDVLFALILYTVMILEFMLLGKLFVEKGTALTETYIICATGIISLVCIGLVFMFCFIRKQQLVSVGFGKSQAKKSFVLGMILLILVVALGVIWSLISGLSIQTNINAIIMRIIYYLVFIGFMEELVFRGYIGTRFYGCITNKRLSVVIVGIMFSLLHIPFHMVYAQMSFLEYISANWTNLFYISIFHCGFQWLYSKYNSIIAPTILHFIMDFIQWFIIF